MSQPDVLKIFEKLHADSSSQLGKDEIELLFQHKLFKCYLPESLGGLNLSMKETLQVIEDAAFINGSLGWLVQIGNGGVYFASNFEEEIARKLFVPQNAVIAGSGTPTTSAKSVEGGYLVSGKWRFCSGSDYASLFTITFFINDEKEILSAVIPRSQVLIHNDWDTVGMRQTSTNTIEIKEVFVPFDQTFSVLQRKSFLSEPIFSFPFELYAQAFFVSVVFGIFKHLLNESDKLMALKEAEWQIKNPVRLQSLNTLIAEGKSLLEKSKCSSNTLVESLTDRTTQTAESSASQEEFARMSHAIRNKVHELYAALGMEVLYREHPIAVCYLDLLTVTQHKLLS